MRILQVHNQYFSGLGGEDTVVRMEAELLREHGHQVRQHLVSTAQLQGAGLAGLVRAGVGAIWSQPAYDSIAAEVAAFRPDVVHVHNTFPLLSPSIYYAARRNGAPVVQTLHNYRLACANAMMLRNNAPCEDCVGHAKWRGLVHRCYSGGSLGLSASVVAMQTVHRARHTFTRQVDAYIALTGFQRDVILRDGIPAELVHVKPNFIRPRAASPTATPRNSQIAFVGSIRDEKGIDLLLAAWSRLQPTQHQLLILGYGPAEERLKQQYGGLASVTWLGSQPTDVVLQALAQSRYLAICSRWYEGFPMVLLEAFSVGTPAIMPRHGAFPSILNGRNAGLFFTPLSEDSLRQTIDRALSISEDEWLAQSRTAQSIAQEFNPESNYQQLMAIYAAAQQNYRRTQPQRSAVAQ